MKDANVCIDLVKLAQSGNKEALNELAAYSEPHLRAYIFRTTLNHDITDDVSQEVMLSLVKSLNTLRKPESFWGWVYRIAHNKIKQFYRNQKAAPASALDADLDTFCSGNQLDEGLGQLISRERSEKVFSAIKNLKTKQRSIIAMRCFDGMSYTEIAAALQCNEITARINFFRAKQALRKQLVGRGLSRTALFSSLVLFGKLTGGSEAGAATVGAGALEVGAVGTVAGAATTKAGMSLMAAAVAIIIAAAALIPEPPEPQTPLRNHVTGMHFTAQSPRSRQGPSEKAAHHRPHL